MDNRTNNTSDDGYVYRERRKRQEPIDFEDRRVRERRQAPSNGERRKRTYEGEERRARERVGGDDHNQRRMVNKHRAEVEHTQESSEVLARRELIERRKMKREKKRKRRVIKRIISFIFLLIFIAACVVAFKIITYKDPIELGGELLNEKQYEEAIVEFNRAIEKDELLDQAYLGIALCKWELGATDEVNQYLELAYSNGATKTSASRNMFVSLALEDEDYTKALEYIEESLAIDTNTEEEKQDLLKNEIACYEKLNDLETAKTKANEYLEMYPDDSEVKKEAEFLSTR